MVAIRFLKRLHLAKRKKKKSKGKKWKKVRPVDCYFKSWKNTKLLKQVLEQRYGICASIGTVRHFTALLIQNDILTEEEELSVEDLIQKMRTHLPGLMWPESGYGVHSYEDFEWVLTRLGIVRERDNPLLYKFAKMKVYSPGYIPESFKIKSMTIIEKSDVKNNKKFERMMIRELKKCPIACVVNVTEGYESYGKGVYDPPEFGNKFEPHSMLLVAYGRYKGKRFFEFQDSNGTEVVGHKGYVRVAAGKGLIDE